jgi:hypothetical protein
LKSHLVFFPVRALLLIARPFVVAFQFSISSPRNRSSRKQKNTFSYVPQCALT